MRTFVVKIFILSAAAISVIGCTDAKPVTAYLLSLLPQTFGLTISNPSVAYVNSAGSVSFNVVYTLAANVTLIPGDVTPNYTGGVSCAVPVVTGSGNVLRTVTLTACTGNGTVGITIGPGTATDSSSNLATASSPSTTAVVDNTAPTLSIASPTVSSINVSGATDFVVTYTGADNVTLATGDVTLNTTGGVTCTKAVSGSGTTTRTVTVSNCTSNGTVGITIAAGTATDFAGNASVGAGPSPVATVSNTGPTLVISAPSPAAVNNTGTVTYTLTYTGAAAVTVGAGDITVNNSTGSCTLNSVTPGNPTSTVKLNNCTGDGNVSISVAANTATDALLNPANAAGPSTAVVVDNTAPTNSIGAPSLTLANNGTAVTYTITYTSLPTITLANGDISLNTTGGASCTIGTSFGGTTGTVTLSSCTGNGTVGINLAAGTACDGVGNCTPAAGPSATFTVDNTPPTVLVSAPSITLANNSSSVVYNVDFSGHSSSSFGVGSVTLNATGGSTCTKAVGGADPNYTVTLTNCTANGTMGITVAASSVSDGINGNASSGASATFAIDNTAPTINFSAGPSLSLVNSSTPVVTYTVSYTGHSSISLIPAMVSQSNTGTATCSGMSVICGANSCDINLDTCIGDGTVKLNVAANSAVDTIGNQAAAIGPSAAFTVDNTAPGMSISAPNINLVNSSGTVVYDIGYTGASAVTLANSDVVLSGATSGCLVNVTGAGLTLRQVSVSSCSGDGTVAISINAGTASDSAGNMASAIGPSLNFTVDNTAPTWGMFNNPTGPTGIGAASNFVFDWDAFSEGVGFSANPYVVEKWSGAGCTGGMVLSAAQSAKNYDWTGLTLGTYSVRIRATDLAGNVGYSPCSPNVTKSIAPKGVFITYTCIDHPGGGGYLQTAGVCDTGADRWATYGLAGAIGVDQHCRDRAASAGLPNAANYVAWASDDFDDAYCRVLGLTGKKSTNCGQGSLPTGGGPWNLVSVGGGSIDGSMIVANNVTQLTSCSPGHVWGNGTGYAPCLTNAIARNEYGNPQANFFHSNTYADGTADSYGSYWTGGGGGMCGHSGNMDTNWTSIWFGAGGMMTDRHLVCFEKTPVNPFGQAYSFDGGSSYFHFNSGSISALYPLTVEAFVKTTATGTNQMIYQTWGGIGITQLYINTSNRLVFSVVQGGCSSGWPLTSAAALSTGTTYHVAGVWDSGNNMRIYINGVLDSSGPGPGTTCGGGTGQQSIGANMSGGMYFQGSIDEMRISDTARYSGGGFAVPTSPFTVDGNSQLILHMDDLTSASGFAAPITPTPNNVTVSPTFLP